MRIKPSNAALAFALALALPGAALGQANHNTARSNKNTVAAPAGDTAPADTTKPDSASGDAAGTAKANIVTTRSNTKGTVAPAPDASAGTADAAPANINTSRSNSKGVAPPAPDGTADAAPATINTSRSNTKAKNTPQ